MALSAFDDKANQPTAAELAHVLGDTAPIWDDLKRQLEEGYPPLTEKWGFGGKKWGWTLGLKQKKRTILYLTPSTGFFYVGFVLGEKAVNAALEGDLPASIVNIIEASPKYAEGRGVRLEIHSGEFLASVLRLAECKMARY